MEKREKTVFLADDDASVRSTLADFFQGTDYLVVGQGCNGIETVEACRGLKPNLVKGGGPPLPRNGIEL